MLCRVGVPATSIVLDAIQQDSGDIPAAADLFVSYRRYHHRPFLCLFPAILCRLLLWARRIGGLASRVRPLLRHYSPSSVRHFVCCTRTIRLV